MGTVVERLMESGNVEQRTYDDDGKLIEVRIFSAPDVEAKPGSHMKRRRRPGDFGGEL